MTYISLAAAGGRTRASDSDAAEIARTTKEPGNLGRFEQLSALTWRKFAGGADAATPEEPLLPLSVKTSVVCGFLAADITPVALLAGVE